MAVTRNIQITWNTVPGTVNYKVYRKKIQPKASNYTFVSNVAAPTLNYTFTGSDVDELDVYKVEAVNASDVIISDSNAIQEIYFPNKSGGVYETNLSTPDGQPASNPVDIPYLSKDEFILSPIANGLGINSSSDMYTNGSLDRILLQASSHVNRYCRRYFQKQTIDETYPNLTIQVSNPRLTVIPLRNSPVQRINSVTVQVLKWFIPFNLEYLIQPFYEQHYYQIVPLLSTAGQGAPLGTGTPIPSVILEQSQLGIVWTNYTCGYDIIPEDIKYATTLIAGKMIGLGKYNPLGLSSFRTQTTSQTFSKTKDDNPIDTEVAAILDPYKFATLRIT
jgi:hypothetical protein